MGCRTLPLHTDTPGSMPVIPGSCPTGEGIACTICADRSKQSGQALGSQWT
jgi:hypothetical protein